MADGTCDLCGEPTGPEEYGDLCEWCYGFERDKLMVARREYAETVEIKVRKVPYRISDLRQAAIENANEPCDDDCKIDRWVVNLLRQRLTNYDEILAGLPSETANGRSFVLGRDCPAHKKIRERVHAELRRVYPRIAALRNADMPY